MYFIGGKETPADKGVHHGHDLEKLVPRPRLGEADPVPRPAPGRTCYYYSVESNTGAPNGGWISPMHHKRGAAEAEYQDQVNKLATVGSVPTV